MIYFFQSRNLLLVIPVLFVLASCQIPVELTMPAATKVPAVPEATNKQPTPAKPIAVGFESSGWEERKKEITAAGSISGKTNRYTQIKTDQKVIAITFDDGPHPKNTPRLLKMLKDRNIKATFYVVGDMVSSYPDVLKQTAEAGHEIGNHTVTHATLSRLSTSGLRKELADAHRQIVEITGIAPRTMRPPGGAIKSSQREYMMEEFGYPTILWSVDPEDWKKPGVSLVASRLVKGAAPGGILLVHDLHSSTVDAMPSALDQLLAQGYRFVTLTELIAMDESK
ncbi:polysaccharide deacetylase family protein [Verrucomicrobiales bacterium]|nr:polysaccharide deacetylase family protein [Verrucomicrobiales bacterium]